MVAHRSRTVVHNARTPQQKEKIMGKKQPMTLDERNDHIVKMYRSGSTMTEVAEAIGLAVPTVYQILKKRKITARTLADKRNQRIEEMYKNGKSASHIAEKFGLTKMTIYNILHKRGVEMRRGSQSPMNRYDLRNNLIMQAHESGARKSEIAAAFKLTPSTVYNIIKTHQTTTH